MNAPTLIVGLGGKGSQIALRVSKMVTEEQRKNIGFAVFDTDVNELAQIKLENPFVRTIQTSTKLTVGEYLDIDKHSMETWFPVNSILNSKTLTEGAGQVRAISRLAFETAVRAGKMNELHKAIEDLYMLQGNEYEQALRVIIVSSLAGGTGSGLILPVSLYIKNYLATRFSQSANITRGFFILPEVFYDIIPSETERNNLKSNAYATLREIDAFLMKGDSTLPDKYKDTVKLEFPIAGTNEFEEYSVRPLDFCFLFDAQNSDGKKLNSHEDYIDHAANCIYSQSIGPMNKRSNSSEDNTIRELTEESGRNRYAGAGSSILIYPYEDVREYLALNWAKECVSNQWLVFDKMLEKRRYEDSLKRNQGLTVKDIDPIEFYVTSVEQMAKDKDPFATAIVNSCSTFDNLGVTKIGDNWNSFIQALMNKIQVDFSNGQNDLDDKRDNIVELISALDKGKSASVWSTYEDVYRTLEEYKGLIQKMSDKSADTVAYAIFRAPSDNAVKVRYPHQIETYMRKASDNSFIHPNAVRYFLYKTLEALKRKKVVLSNQNRDLNAYFDDFAVVAFDDNSTETVVETVDDLKTTKKGSRFKITDDQQDLIRKYREYLENLNQYRYSSIQEVVIEQGIDYVTEMCKAFENFFKSFEDKVIQTQKRINILSKKHEYNEGIAKRYVCASKKCLERMLKKYPYSDSYFEISGELSEDIYSRIRGYAMLTSKPEDSKYFDDIFNEGIVGYFKNSVSKTYGASVDMDIISAIEAEAEFEKNLFNENEIIQYVKSVFKESKVLAAPFIERPIGEEKQPVNACAYNKYLNPNDDSPRSKLINSELKNFGGEEDEDIPKNMIFFYKSFYGLRANELSKFAPAYVSPTHSRTDGPYYKAYFDLISKIHPVTHKSKVITPHIDKWWHNISVLPDLDERSQNKTEYNIYSAFFWGMLQGFIRLIDEGNNQNVYRLNPDDLDMTDVDDTLVVSNSTPCDSLYEVVDALGIFPELVTGIHKKIDELIEEDNIDKVTFEESFFYDNLKNFRIREYPFGKENKPRSVFDIPMLIKKSIPSKQYFEDRVIKILEVELCEISEYIKKITDDDMYSELLGKVIMEQFDMYLDYIKYEGEKSPKIYHDYLFTRTCNIVAKFLETNGQKANAKIVRTTLRDIGNQVATK